MDWEQWQESWDRQQEFYMPDREERFRVMLDMVEAVAGPAPRVLDLACGTATISRRLFARLPEATSVGIDRDPALLAIARGTFADDTRMTFVTADIKSPDWMSQLPDEPFDAIVTATALHWLKAEPLVRLYGDLGKLLRPGGIFLNADHMPDPGTPLLNALDEAVQQAHQQRVTEAGTLDWADWWVAAAADPQLAADVAASREILSTHVTGETHPAEWHLTELREAGFLEAGVIWRSVTDALVAAIR
ncbi:class I SAM-dependent methyltransferase [Nocardia brasiliensis]|uniref:class I SAM-dependent methyltransferase n=1 Tax=Nocardia brasiliensis TaxID=37326 RepID=UPI00245635B6|nr:class I SAM-dependent methyltransferase [Nocardia brasiliensis]